MFIEIFIVVALTVVNGLLAMSEMAVVSSRPARLRVLADQGSRGATVAIKLGENPGRFLSSVQIGITLVGVLSGAFSGATLGARLSSRLIEVGLSPGLGDALGVGSVVVLITYLSLIVGELVPKQIALRNPESVASRVAPTMLLVSKLTLPLVWLLDKSGRLVLALLGQSGKSADSVTDEEIKTILAEAHSAGVIETEESDMIAGVMRLSDRNARALMTPRRDVEVIEVDDDPVELRAKLRATSRSRLPVREGHSDEVIGVLFVKDFYDAAADGGTVDFRSLIREVPIVSDLSMAVDVMKALRKSTTHMALVYDEHGHFEGVITSGDILEAITGAFPETNEDEPSVVKREDGSFLIAGWMPIDEFAHQFGIRIDGDAEFQTVAGLILDELGHLPQLGETLEKDGLRFEVIDLDRRRIDKVLLTRM